MEGGCLGYPGASTVASQLQNKILPYGWQIPATPPWTPIPGTHQHWLNQWKEKIEGGVGCGNSDTAATKKPHKTAEKQPLRHCNCSGETQDSSCDEAATLPREPALQGLITDQKSPLSSLQLTLLNWHLTKLK